MFEFIIIAIFIWLVVKAIGLALKLTWGIAKITASILIGLAFPALILCLVFVGGVALLVPLAEIYLIFLLSFCMLIFQLYVTLLISSIHNHIVNFTITYNYFLF